MSANRLVKFFPDSDLRAGHDGLARKASNAGISVSNLQKGEMLAFVNTRKNKLKIFASGGVMAYYRARLGEKIDPRIIQHLPDCFNGAEINYDKAMTKVLEKHFPQWFNKEKGSK